MPSRHVAPARAGSEPRLTVVWAPAESVRDATRVSRKGAREIETEIRKLDREEKLLVIQLKREAKARPESARATAKQLINLRKSRARLQGSAAQLSTLGTHMKQQEVMHTAMGAVGKSATAMNAVNAAMDPAKVTTTAQEFAKQSARADMASEAMDGALEGMFEVDEDEADALVDNVLDELGIEAAAAAPAAPTARIGAPARVAPDAEVSDAEVDAMLAQLRG